MNKNKLSHVNQNGNATMVDVGGKQPADRVAVAHGEVLVSDIAWQLIKDNTAQKGDVLATARIAGIMAAKNTGNLIPLCHQLALDSVAVEFDMSVVPVVGIIATARCFGKTGVEMEALTAVTVAALTIYDMIKAVDRSAVINNICLKKKSGGKSGNYTRSE